MRSLDDPRRPMRAAADDLLPTWFRRGIVSVMITTVALAWVFGGSVRGEDEAARDRVLASRELRFVDLDNGGIVIRDAAHDETLAAFRSGEGSFVRGVLRGLAHERRTRGIDREPPFRLVAFESGLLSLIDPSTGEHVALSAFGQTNVETFARLLADTPRG